MNNDIHHPKGKASGFTLIELLISVTLIAVIVGVVALFNFKSTFERSRDAKRKMDLNKLVRIMEDYYNDNSRYPPSDYYYNGTISNISWGSPFTPYLPQLPQDPLSPSRDYFYFGDPNGKFFSIFAKLENTGDPDIALTGCPNGCGPYMSYNYVVHSANVKMMAGLPNGVAIPGKEGSATPTQEAGGGGGGGGDEPTPTTGPTSTPGPSPTYGPIPTHVPGTCGMDNACVSDWCGAGIDPPGEQCTSFPDVICCPVYFPTGNRLWRCRNAIQWLLYGSNCANMP